MTTDTRFAKLLADIPEDLARNEKFVVELEDYAKVITIKKGDYLLRSGELCRDAYFVNRGIFINQFISEKGNEIVVGFSIDDFYPFLSAIGYITEAPSEFEIKALTDGELLCFSRDQLNQMSRNYPPFMIYYQRAMMAIISKLHMISVIRQSYTTEEFMHYLYTHYISLVNRVPDKYIARFMGISTSWYCKLKKRLH